MLRLSLKKRAESLQKIHFGVFLTQQYMLKTLQRAAGHVLRTFSQPLWLELITQAVISCVCMLLEVQISSRAPQMQLLML